MIVQVQCYAGRKPDERLVRFQIGDELLRRLPAHALNIPVG